jgi:hypothetical protein
MRRVSSLEEQPRGDTSPSRSRDHLDISLFKWRKERSADTRRLRNHIVSLVCPPSSTLARSNPYSQACTASFGRIVSHHSLVIHRHILCNQDVFPSVVVIEPEFVNPVEGTSVSLPDRAGAKVEINDLVSSASQGEMSRNTSCVWGKGDMHFALARSHWFREEGAVIASEQSSCKEGRDAWMVRSQWRVRGRTSASDCCCC